VVAEGGRAVCVQLELVVRLELDQLGHGLEMTVDARADEVDKGVTPFVDHKRAQLALVALFAEAPDEVFAMRAEGRLLEEARNETMVFDQRNVPLFEGPFAGARPGRLRAGTLVGGGRLSADGRLFVGRVARGRTGATCWPWLGGLFDGLGRHVAGVQAVLMLMLMLVVVVMVVVAVVMVLVLVMLVLMLVLVLGRRWCVGPAVRKLLRLPLHRDKGAAPSSRSPLGADNKHCWWRALPPTTPLADGSLN
jgi:hypothetical protein